MSSTPKSRKIALATVSALCVVSLGFLISSEQSHNPPSHIALETPALQSTQAMPASPARTPDPAKTPERATVSQSTAANLHNATAWEGAHYAQSLAGTDIDGQLRVDAQGNLMVDLGVKDFFDYFLSAVGEVSLEQAIEQINQQAQLRVPPNAVEQTLQLLESYLAYQHAMQDMMASPIPPEKQQDYGYYSEVMSQTFEQLKSLRRQYLSPEAADAFFALEETYSQFAVASMQIRADKTLTEAEKQAKIQQLENTMPTQMRVAQEEARLTAELATQARQLYDQGTNKAEIRSLLSMQYDEQTVSDMLAHYDREAQWTQRLEHYTALKTQLDEAGLPASEHARQLDTLRGQYFREDELPRLVSHEAIARKQG